ncbi:hypothetical protein BJ138DRAFT_1133892 [Hygrophoropsis aurantiaca]|uniref:Uncharacterized protein n=1 Tax=Hygrophoropsis aurantiaca TaxID=72124 RepID=A0ACB8AMF5_9AGAM|nr:hypothetical protein BJ138DRAFT_1133892 [Hygrophoropsis aurantiaca]
MAILLTGGTGKTSTPLAQLLQDANIPFLLASRKGPDGALPTMQAIKFDWLDSRTFERPFQHEFPNKESISAIYLVAPTIPDPASVMNPFIDLAVKDYGVKRFVLLGGSSTEKGSPYHVGPVWQHLDDLGVEYCVLRPTWFMENFSQEQHLISIRDEGKIYTASGNGKIPFISAADIAAVAFHTLVDKKLHDKDYRVLGPELLTHDEIAAKLSQGLGRDILHVKLSEEQNVQRYLNLGLPEVYAKFLTSLEIGSADGMEERLKDDHDVERVTGRPPLTFDSWVYQHASAWLK